MTKPLYSIVVPTYRRPQLLERCLTSLLEQDMERSEFEIVVADDADDPATRRLVATYARAAGDAPAVRYVPVTEHHGPAAARNAGWCAAQGEILAFTDDDCTPTPTWLREGTAALVDGVAAAWGRIVVPLPANPTDYERDAARLQDAGFVTANVFCRRAALEDIGGLDERFTAPWREDSDLYFTLLEHGQRVVAAPRAVVVHPVRPAPWGASLTQQRKILFDALLFKKHRSLYRRMIRRAPPWRYYATACALALAISGLLAGYVVGAAFGAVAWAVLTAEFTERRLRDTSRRPWHVAEMALTSALIPLLAVFWRLAGAVRFRVAFL